MWDAKIKQDSNCYLQLHRTAMLAQQGSSILTFQPSNYSIKIFTHLKLCLADAIHNFKWVKIIQIWQKGGQQF